ILTFAATTVKTEPTSNRTIAPTQTASAGITTHLRATPIPIPVNVAISGTSLAIRRCTTTGARGRGAGRTHRLVGQPISAVRIAPLLCPKDSQNRAAQEGHHR